MIYAGLLASIFVYPGVGYFISRTFSSSESAGPDEMVSRIFYILAAVIIAIIFCVRKWLIPSSVSSAVGPAEISGLMSKYRTGNILVFVLSESIGLLGLVLFLLGGALSHLIRFALASLALMGMLYPKRIE
jgi:hypothetical protein